MTAAETDTASVPPDFLDSVTIRPFEEKDYAELVALENLVWPEHVETVDEMRWGDANRAEKIKWGRFVAELPGVGIIGRGGYGQSNDMYHPQKFGVGVLVHPDYRNRGLGTRLYDTVMDAIAPFDPILIKAGVREDKEGSLRFVRQRGYHELMRDWESTLDVAAFDLDSYADAEKRTQDAGIVIKTYAELANDEGRDRKVYELDWAVTLDMPSSDTMTEPGFEDWRKRNLDRPSFMPDAWFIACDGDKYVGISFLSKSQGSNDVYQGTTGVLRSHRRKGIALALKIRGVRWAKEAGKDKIITWNATSNRPMLSINEAMGFVKKPAWIDFAKDLQNSDAPFFIRPFNKTDRDYQAQVDLNNAYFPEHPETVEHLRSEDARRDPKLQNARFIAETKTGELVGLGLYDQHLWSYDPHKFFVLVEVAPNKQKEGIGNALYAHVLNALASLAPKKLSTFVREDLADSVQFAQKRGFVEEMREWESVLDVPAFDFAPWQRARQKAAQNGITICSYADLASDADRDRKLWEMETPVAQDIPSPDPITPLDFAQYEKEILKNPHFLPDGFLVAVEKATGAYVGVSTLWKRTSDGDLNQGLTGVLRDHRRKGIALALKLQGIEFAKSYGAKSIRTENATTNEAMLAINVALGFDRQPAWISFGNVLEPSSSGDSGTA